MAPAVHIYEYDPDNGARYAQAFALYSEVPEDMRIFFYDAAGNDCANFASQCIWAAYGGWIPGTAEPVAALNRQRVKENVRQTGIWYGSASFAGTPRWCRVEELFAYLTAKKASGPQGVRVAEGTWDSVRPESIQKGDLVQLVVSGYAPYRYGHNLYVTKQGRSYSDTRVCCHSYDRRNAPLTSFSLFPDAYPKLRVIHFLPAGFTK